MVIAKAERLSALREFWGIKTTKSYFMKQETMTPTMTPTMGTANVHKDIPGNPSTSKSSKVRLSDRSNGQPLRVLSEADWKFWIHNGYIVIKNAVPRSSATFSKFPVGV